MNKLNQKHIELEGSDCLYENDCNIQGLKGEIKSVELIRYHDLNNNSISRHTVHFYNNIGFIDSIYHYENDTIFTKFFYVRNKNNSLKEIYLSDMIDTIIFESYYYDDKDCKIVNSKIEGRYDNTNFYDDRGRLLKSKIHSIRGNDTTTTIQTYFYKENNLIELTEVGSGDSTIFFLNNGINNITRREIHSNNKLSYLQEFEYLKYDNYGNWIEANEKNIFYKNKESVFENFVKRNIEYY